MNRRSFIKLISAAVACMTIQPVEFLTPYSPPAQMASINYEMIRKILEKFYLPAIKEQLEREYAWENPLYKKILRHSMTKVGKGGVLTRTTPPI